MSIGINLAEAGVLPDSVIRFGIRQLLRQRLDAVADSDQAAWLAELQASPIAIEQDAANRQHYEVPADFFELVLGRHLKYSSCWYETGDESLDEAEAAMLALCCERAGLRDGMHVLDVGCGWGSLSLWMAEHYPRATIVGLSNSTGQRRFITERAAARGLSNLQIVTADLAEWQPSERFDRIVSVECLEHMRNYGRLFERFAGWLEPDGKAFVHVFCHERYGYPFETEGEDNWMGRHFFTGGQMPSFQLFEAFDEHLRVAESWRVGGRHYGRTARAWLDNMGQHKRELLAVLEADLGGREAKRMFHRWRMFFMACEELFNWDAGREWLVGHYLLEPQR